MHSKTIIIGIDHGWSLMKTKHHVFASGVKEIKSKPALFDDILEYEGRYYKIGGDRLEVKDVKTKDDNFFLLTLAAVAKELKTRGGIREADVLLAVGLPLTRIGEERDGFVEYLMRSQDIMFTYEKTSYSVRIEYVAVYPQCFAAIAERLNAPEDPLAPMFPHGKKVVAVDVGSWTIDMMPVTDRKADESKGVTEQTGVITCMRAINEQCVRLLNGAVDESDIQYAMRHGSCDIGEAYFEIIRSECEAFIDRLVNSIRERRYNLKTTPIVFVGGGAAMVRNFGRFDKENFAGVSYIDDIKANAKGYERLTEMALENIAKKA
jgi:plasmid segregation protein ParM